MSKSLNEKRAAGHAALVVPRADIAVSVAIVYSWWLLKVLSIKWLKYSLGVFK